MDQGGRGGEGNEEREREGGKSSERKGRGEKLGREGERGKP